MIDCLIFVSTVLAVLGCGLIAGAFFAFSAFVMTALGRLPAASGISAMQSIIAAIKGPLFLVVFFATAALAALLGLAAPLRWSEPGAGYLLLGSLLFLNGPFGVTLMKNLPLNNRLAAVEAGERRGRALLDRVPRHLGPMEPCAVDRLARRGGLLHHGAGRRRRTGALARVGFTPPCGEHARHLARGEG